MRNNIRILAAALLLLATTVHAEDPARLDMCECNVGQYQTTFSDELGCTFTRGCQAGAGICDPVTKGVKDPETGIITSTPVTGYWGPWTEVCYRPKNGERSLEQLLNE